MTFLERMAQEPVILLDGATGSELEKRGLKIDLPLWSSTAYLSEEGRSLLRTIHEDYIMAGSEVITANTFRTTYRTLNKAGLRHKSTAWTFEGVEMVRRAVDRVRPDRSIYVAGSVAPLEDCYQPERVPSDGELHDEHRRHIDNLFEAGVDLFLIETMNTIREATMAADYAVQTGRPVLVSFVCGQPDQILDGESLANAASLCSVIKVCGILVNCVAPPLLGENLAALHAVATLPIGGYANLLPTAAGKVIWSPEEYAHQAAEWVDRFQLKFIGGCCGSGPLHIRTLAEALHVVS